MDDLCNCHDCDRSYRYVVQNYLDLRIYKKDLKSTCSTCEGCTNHSVYLYLMERFPDYSFTIFDLLKLPEDLRKGVCNFIAEKHYIE